MLNTMSAHGCVLVQTVGGSRSVRGLLVSATPTLIYIKDGVCRGGHGSVGRRGRLEVAAVKIL